MKRTRLASLLLAMILLVTLPGAMSATTSPGVPSTLLTDLAASNACSPLPPPSSNTVNVSTVDQLESAVNNAASGTTILVADGTYNLDGVYLRFDTPNVTLRSASGNREAVILDGNYQTTEIVQIATSNVTIADLTLREALYHPIHVMSTDDADTNNTLIYNVHVIDPGQQAIKINPVEGGYYTDNGVIACSHIELTDAGREQVWNINGSCYTGGVDAHQSRDWVIRDNLIEGFWCANDLAEHGIHLWRTCRDPIVERNVLRNNARGIGFGMATDGTGRTYPDDACPYTTGYVDHYRGVIRNNFISADDPNLFNSDGGFDCGICLWNACSVQTFHNTVYTADTANTFSSIEWRFANTRVELTNNLVNHTMRERDGAIATQSGNLTNAPASWFVNAASGDLHLVSTATSAIDQVSAPGGVTDDIDGDPRPIGALSDVGADEYGTPPPAAVTDLRVTSAITTTGVLTAALRWTPPATALTTTSRYSRTLITIANWNSAPLFGSVSGAANVYTGAIPYTNGVVYFALKSQNAAGDSALSNNAFWPYLDVYLPLIRR
jgi:hypothetical protein